MTSFPLAALLAIAATQAPSTKPAIPESAGAALITLGTQGLPETSVGTHSFKKLFTVSEDTIREARLQAATELQRAVEAKSRVVCGMTVIQADPRIDPKMIHRPAPSASTTTFHIRRISPSVCAD